MYKKAKFISTIISVILLLFFIQIPNKVIATYNNEISLDEFNFPDENFKRILKEKFPEITKDDILTNEEIQKIKSLDISENIIKDLSGIEYFTNLEYLNVSVNKIKNLDLSNNLKLVTLDASNNQLLTELKLPGNIVNLYLNFNYNLEKLNVSKLKNLKILYASDVPINNIDTSKLINLIALNLENTGLKTINLTNNIKLEYLNVSDNNLEEINLSNNTNLMTVNLQDNILNKIFLPNSVQKETNIEYYSQKVDEGFVTYWYDGDTLILKDNEIVMKGQILTSKTIAKSILISYQANGGTGKMESHTIDFGENTYLLQNNFTRKGYIFKGWSTSSNSLNIQFEDKDFYSATKYPSNGKVTLYAIWEPIKYIVEFDANGGTGNMNQMKELSYGIRYKLIDNNFRREGYKFIGWSKIQESSIVHFKNKETIYNLISENGGKIKLYAVWQKNNYNVNFNIDGKIISYVVGYNDKIKMPQNPIKTGYTFMGWYDIKTDKEYNFNNPVNSSTTLIAKWRVNQYSVILNGNNNTKNNMDILNLKYDRTYKLPANTYSKEGHKFIGWTIFQNGPVKYLDKSSIKNLSNKDNDIVILYAKWEKVKSNFEVQVSDVSVTYNGKPQTINIKNVPAGSLIEYRTCKSANWTNAKPVRTSVGTTIVYYRITNSDYNTYEGNSKITIKAKQMKNISIDSISNKTYTGKQIKPIVTVKEGKTILKKGSHYSVSYGKNKNTGKAYVKIIGKGNYTGTITKYFNILPKAPSLSIKTSNGSITVTTKSTGASGYEILYSTSKNGKYKSINTTSKTKKITRLTKRKKYYVKVRAYKIIDGKKVYSGYSGVKTIKVK